MTRLQDKRIGDVAKAKGGKRLPKGMEVQDEETSHPYLRVVDFGDDGIKRSEIKFISQEAFEQVSRYTISSDDIYVSIAGTIGRVGIVPDDLSGASLTENAAKLTEISEAVDKHYLMYFLRSAAGRGALQNHAGGTSQPKLALFRLEDIRFPCPPLPHQQRIAEVLTAYDELMENNRRRMELLEKSAQLLYREWFVRLRFPGHGHARILRGVPENWEKKRLDALAEVNRATLPSSYDGQIEYIDIASVVPGEITETTSFTFKEAPSRARRMVQHGDILWSCVRPNRRSHAVVWKPAENVVASTGFAVITPVSVPCTFIYLAITTDAFVGYLENQARGVAYPAVLAEDFERAEILIPPKRLLEDFNEVVEPMFAQISNLRQQNQKLRAARDLLLPRLMNGEIEV